MCYKKFLLPIIGLLLLASVTGCSKLNLYEKLKWFPQNAWASSDTAKFSFTIKDSALYKMYFVVRHTDAYHFNNIWVDMHVKDPDSSYTVKREFRLANGQQWLGTGMGDVFEHRIAFANNAGKLKPGNYQFTLTPVMREDPLENIVNVGIRVERQ